ncbi:hypothetical protein N7471_011548 [Penicillium samsonianum]|uniref:uncharacterized protein n=1 Tax=Penicillium samsonianum TaxID=1882272 RepID=UPI0025476A22|nr:uncharacterized protein N7471_011548 [Penicillium samsonianum]KAJ6124231.1 hypothetical protein N7471_011548 [Penicillium samsonianum]
MGKIKWDAMADQTLLAKILETHDLSVDVAKVAEAWPVQEDGHRPTPRALKERLNRIRENVRIGNPAASGPSSPVTPKKRTPRKKPNETPTPAGPSRKRKRVPKDTAADEDQVNVKKEEDLSTEEKELLDESLIKQETGLEHTDPLVHREPKEETLDAESEKTDPEWADHNDEDADSDSDQLLK